MRTAVDTMNAMNTYLVGGAVRDKQLGLPVKESDWVVVGGSPQELLDAGYKQVGKDFPVFLHPQSREEYALARTERKSGSGYTGFEVFAGPDVTLEDDLKRRDLTINAIAETEDGTLIDPYNGLQDIEQRLLRHVSDAFGEDPLRVLRVARFAARFTHLGFTIAPETMQLITTMSGNGELSELSPERVWRETQLALETQSPDVFFQVLRDCGALAVIFPELDALFGVPQPEHWHPEIDTGVHSLMSLQVAARLSGDPATRFAALVHDLGKGLTPEEYWPSHRGHEVKGVALIEALCKRTGAPNRFRDLARHVSQYHLHSHKAKELRPETVLKLFESVDAFRKPERFEAFLIGCEADARGRTGMEEDPYPQATLLKKCLAAATAISAADVEPELSGKAIGKRIHELRVAAIKGVKPRAKKKKR